MISIIFQSIRRFYNSKKNTSQKISIFIFLVGKNVALHVLQLKKWRVGDTLDIFKNWQFLITALIKRVY